MKQKDEEVESLRKKKEREEAEAVKVAAQLKKMKVSAYGSTCPSKWQAFKLATLTGFAEPLGVIIVAYLFSSSLSLEILKAC
ncbi:PREDICTED: zinc transporter ZTP29 [Prunus dulcis]|uniref:PREDICTED: zinc transporter ZTP29 n=1 Tax=Prunus dulcis TaxID=3755 RepID=A0A5E4GHN7_PRUDU|nr:PREDICTED: zinc transporter ZTP29 [Prunus dulcis]